MLTMFSPKLKAYCTMKYIYKIKTEKTHVKGIFNVQARNIQIRHKILKI